MGATVGLQVTVNGQRRESVVEPRLLLVHYVRDELGLTGTNVGCDTTNCGACTVHLNGEAVKSKEDPRMITGRSRYVDDIVLPGMLHAVIVRSPEAHARIVSIDKSAAEQRDEVVAVFTGEDLADDFAGPLPMVWAPPGVE